VPWAALYGDRGKSAQDVIEISPTGAQAVHGQMAAQFSGDITSTGAIKLTTAAGDVFQSRPAGLYYFDSALGQVTQIASVQSGQAILYPPNAVVYSNLLSGINADLMVVWARNGYEQNLVIKQSLPSPESFGFSSATTRVQLWTIMDSCPVPVRQRTFTLRSGLMEPYPGFHRLLVPGRLGLRRRHRPIAPARPASGREGRRPICTGLDSSRKKPC
jgi:hypothetical protein